MDGALSTVLHKSPWGAIPPAATGHTSESGTTWQGAPGSLPTQHPQRVLNGDITTCMVDSEVMMTVTPVPGPVLEAGPGCLMRTQSPGGRASASQAQRGE